MVPVKLVYSNEEVASLLPFLEKLREQIRGSLKRKADNLTSPNPEAALNALDRQLTVMRAHAADLAATG